MIFSIKLAQTFSESWSMNKLWIWMNSSTSACKSTFDWRNWMLNQSSRHQRLKSLALLLASWCYEHAWINQSSDLTLINLIRTSHDVMLSLNLAHICWTLQVILSTSSRCSALSSFISFIILLDKHIWSITSHLYRV